MIFPTPIGLFGGSARVGSWRKVFDCVSYPIGVYGFMPALVTIVETAAYLTRAEKVLADGEREAVKLAIAANPLAGDLIRGSGGVRKLRFGVGARGKRGGVRVVYYFHSEWMPAFLLTVFAKNERSDLSQSEIATLRKLATTLVATYGQGSMEHDT